LKQRTRWYQGHMTAGRRIPELWRSERISHGSALETILYLLVPWVLDLPWSILYHVAIVRFAMHWADVGLTGSTGWWTYALLYLVAFYPALITGVLCRRRDPQISWPNALLLGHSFVAMNYLSWACSWRALFRMVRGKTGWEKTTRSVEGTSPAPNAVPEPATVPVLVPAMAAVAVPEPVAVEPAVVPAAVVAWPQELAVVAPAAAVAVAPPAARPTPILRPPRGVGRQVVRIKVARPRRATAPTRPVPTLPAIPEVRPTRSVGGWVV
jgi:hypothetical protein